MKNSLSRLLKTIFHEIYSFYWERFRPHTQQISLQYWLSFKNYHYLNFKNTFFLSEPVTKLRFCCKNNSKCTIWICQSIIMCEVLCWNDIKDTCQSWAASHRAEWPFCRRYGMISLTSSLIKHLYHFATEFNRRLIWAMSYCKRSV